MTQAALPDWGTTASLEEVAAAWRDTPAQKFAGVEQSLAAGRPA